MTDAVAATTASLDRQIATIAVKIAGGRLQGSWLLRAVCRGEETPMAAAFRREAGALLRARCLLEVVASASKAEPKRRAPLIAERRAA